MPPFRWRSGAHGFWFSSVSSIPVGCASTFTRGGAEYESGATLFSGLGPDQLFGRWIRRHGLETEVRFLDPVVEFRSPEFTLAVPPDRDEAVRRIVALSPPHADEIRAFFREQGDVSAAVWPLIENPSLLPPFGPGAWGNHLRALGRYTGLLSCVGRTLSSVLERHGLAECRPLRSYVDAVTMITMQTPSDTAEAPFGMAALDYFFRGTGHVHGGIGRLAWGLVNAIRASGGSVRFSDEVRHLVREDSRWRVASRRGVEHASNVVVNLLPQALRRLLGEGLFPSALSELESRVENGWGAAMLYLKVDQGAVEREEAHHLELVLDQDQPLTEGNHLFCSISGTDEARARDGSRTVTVSTHVPIVDPVDPLKLDEVHRRMKRGLERLAPELVQGTQHIMTASPRTFERFTGRYRGFVGGVPRTAGLHNYRGLRPRALMPGLYLVGDSVFPGQSTLATATGGVKVADAIASSRATGISFQSVVG